MKRAGANGGRGLSSNGAVSLRVRQVRGLVLLAALGGVSAGAAVAQQQTPAAPCPTVKDAQGNPVPDPSCAQGTQPSAAQRFPFPGSSPGVGSAPVVPQNPAVPQSPAATDSQSAPAAAPSPEEPASKRFPFPGSSSGDKPAPVGPPLQDAGSSGSSSNSSSSNSSAGGEGGAAADDPDANDPAAIPRSKRHKLPPVPRQTPDQREQEDVQVAGFYFNDGNFKGSYDRAKDAVTLDADDAAAHLALAESARKLGKLDEAEREYKRCLALDPVPKQRKVAEKALKEMTGGE